MNILKKLLSVAVVNAAVLMITLSFMAWVFDSTLLDASALTRALKENGVAKAIADAIPEMAKPEEQRGPNGEILPEDIAETAKIKETISKSIDEPYIQKKIDSVVTSVIGYIKTGNPQPVLDLSDFPARIESATGEVPVELKEELSKPINLTEKVDAKALSSVRQGYDGLKLFKIIGPIIAVILLIFEWLLTQKGKRLGKTAWVFIAAGLWGMLWWLVISRAPDILMTKVEANQEAEKSMVAIVDSLLNSLSSLLSQRFLQFGIACIAVAGILLLVRFILGRRSKSDAVSVASARPSKPVQAGQPVKYPGKK